MCLLRCPPGRKVSRGTTYTALTWQGRVCRPGNVAVPLLDAPVERTGRKQEVNVMLVK